MFDAYYIERREAAHKEVEKFEAQYEMRNIEWLRKAFFTTKI